MPKAPTLDELVFSLKSFAASMLALYIAFGMGLPRPFWAMLTTYVVSSPLSGTVRSKAVYRVAGTVAGSVAAIVLTVELVNAPELLSLAVGLAAPLVDLGLDRAHLLVGNDEEVARAAGRLEHPDSRHALTQVEQHAGIVPRFQPRL